jgi:hypothetical protein
MCAVVPMTGRTSSTDSAEMSKIALGYNVGTRVLEHSIVPM